MSEIALLALRPFMARGKRIEVGSTVRLPAVDAAEVLKTTRAALVDDRDRDVMTKAVDADTRRHCQDWRANLRP